MPIESRRILRYMHCTRCQEQKPVSQSMAEYARLCVGITSDGIEVWCNRHRMPVVTMTIAELARFVEHPPACTCRNCPQPDADVIPEGSSSH